MFFKFIILINILLPNILDGQQLLLTVALLCWSSLNTLFIGGKLLRMDVCVAAPAVCLADR